jgi:hypothetical protein
VDGTSRWYQTSDDTERCTKEMQDLKLAPKITTRTKHPIQDIILSSGPARRNFDQRATWREMHKLPISSDDHHRLAGNAARQEGKPGFFQLPPTKKFGRRGGISFHTWILMGSRLSTELFVRNGYFFFIRANILAV